MLRSTSLLFIFCLGYFSLAAQQKFTGVFVDKKGVIRYSDTQEEASFFGVNYTLPFAHAYRATGYVGKDRKEAIDRDVYHFARLGFNAYRLHIWDVEIADSEGRLLENEHLDLLDYLLYKLKERNIKIVLTCMTNFGNGYPERNQDTGGFSYLYNKCEIHNNPEAINAQENYIFSLIKHRNPYTGTTYLNDPDILGFEINNEPCHAGTVRQTQDYIDRMVKAIRKTGTKKPVFYNVSHNIQQIEAYYRSDIQGTTYQWYPIGLVAGRTRKGNFLPYVDRFLIPFKETKGFESKAKLIYEYDPADVTYSHLHPVMARSFRSAGFQWITQFAYDPIDLAPYNTEYQTHYLNLAYTPQKALSMKIAAEVSQSVPLNKSYAKYPNDTVFEDFRVSYAQDLSELNCPEKFYYSNHTTSIPVNPDKLESVAGYGNSPIVNYEGTGAYFIDRLEEGVWRLEIMPDVASVHDPFTKPSLKRAVSVVLRNPWDITIRLPDLKDEYWATSLEKKNVFSKQAEKGRIQAIVPGIYLLKRKEKESEMTWEASTRWKNIRLGEYAAPETSALAYSVRHLPPPVAENNVPLLLKAEIAGPGFPDSVIVYTNKISFWRDNNPHYKMERIQGYTYQAIVPVEELKGDDLKYCLVVCKDGKQVTFPDGAEASPLDWDYAPMHYRIEKVVAPESPVELFTVHDEWSGLEAYLVPEGKRINRKVVNDNPAERPMLQLSFDSHENTPHLYLQQYVGDVIENRRDGVLQSETICIRTKGVGKELQAGFIARNGFTYKAAAQVVEDGIARIPLSDLTQTETVFLPYSYPAFLGNRFSPDVHLPFSMQEVEKLEISIRGEENTLQALEIGSVWLE